jgi:hypothetical protein
LSGGHIDVSRKHSHQQHCQAASRQTPESLKKEAQTSQNFGRATDLYKHFGEWHEWRDDPHVGARVKEVQKSASNEKAGKHE